MERTIYLPSYAIKQISTSNNSSVWANPIPYSEKPDEYFSLKYTFNPDNNKGINPTDKENFYPDKTDPKMTLERLVKIDISTFQKTLLNENQKIVEVS